VEMIIRPPSPKDFARFKEANREIDAIREIMFEIIIADEYAVKNQWEEVKEHLDRAREWFSKAKSFGSIDQWYLERIKGYLNRLYELLAEKDPDKWSIDMDDIMPDLITTVFIAFMVASSEGW
jgi:hypothetical protein